ncbi:unnamed protein product, partial [Owenia fusiformis]
RSDTRMHFRLVQGPGLSLLSQITAIRGCVSVKSIHKHPFRYQIHHAMSSEAKPKIFITRRVPQKGVDLLKEKFDIFQWNRDDPIPREELLKQVAGKDALFCLLTEKIDDELLEIAGPQLKVVGTMSVGYDHVDIEACKKRNIPVGFTPNVLTDSVAELTVALLLATSRRLVEGVDAVKTGKWGTWGPMWLLGKDLKGSTVGICGFGRIGYAVAERLKPFKIGKLLYSDQVELPYAKDVGAEFASQEQLLKESDFVIACVALTPETKGMFNKDLFKTMKNNAVFVNTSRGGVVNHDDLYDALKSGEIWGAGLDVTVPEPLPTDSPLLSLNNCVVLPHIASATEDTRSDMSELTARNILAAMNGESMPAQVK